MKNAPMSRSFTMFSLAALLVLSACGGGGGDSPTQAVAGVSGDIEFQSADLVNGERRSASINPQLGIQALIADVARQHSQAMRDQGFFGHRGPDGKNLRTRLQEAGIQFSSAAENLARVDASSNPAAVAHRELMASTSHRSNILGTGFNVIGVGVVQSGDTYWVTQIFIQQ